MLRQEVIPVIILACCVTRYSSSGSTTPWLQLGALTTACSPSVPEVNTCMLL